MGVSTRTERLLACFFLGTLLFFMGSILFIYAADKIPARTVASKEQAEAKREGIDWQALYPFPAEDAAPLPTKEEPQLPLLQEKLARYLEYVRWKKGNLEGYTTFKLLWNMPLAFAELTNGYEALIQWNFVVMSEYNGVVKLRDGYLTTYTDKRDVSDPAYLTIRLAKFCEERDIHFLYVNAPAKVCKFEDADISGTLDFVNQNADEFLRMLADAGVDYCDLRRALHDEGLSHHGAFFRTDHHWLPEAGLWAARHILWLLRDRYGYPVDASVLDADRFTRVVYPSWFLGSQGRKVTLARTEPEDISLLYPKYPTSLTYQIPDLGINVSGDFSVTYDMSQVEEKDYYNKSVYGVYNHGVHALIKITNQLLDENVKVLIVHDSFGNCVTPFLSMGLQKIYALNLRRFDGSLEACIDSIRPDVVIVLYYSEEIGRYIDWNTHIGHFDFR